MVINIIPHRVVATIITAAAAKTNIVHHRPVIIIDIAQVNRRLRRQNIEAIENHQIRRATIQIILSPSLMCRRRIRFDLHRRRLLRYIISRAVQVNRLQRRRPSTSAHRQ